VGVHGRHDTAEYRVISPRLWRNLWRARPKKLNPLGGGAPQH
jgi:hypothetical protein